ncbi:hypothetical protein KAR91_82855, partial [Candidatus Pacearchaeota archaeon]|nr:hypothetical protein [Candidatus Pacearchaeota archaeon]
MASTGIIGDGDGGSGFVLFTKTADGQPAIFTGADRTAAETERDDYFTANPGDLDLLDANEFLLIKLVDESTDPDTEIYQNYRDPDFFDVSGVVTGPAGASASSLFFSSISERQDFFAISENLELLEENLPCITNVNDTSMNFVWTDPTVTVVTYDDTLWRNTEVTASPDSFTLGQDGATISSASNVINFFAANGTEYVLQGVRVDTGGTAQPFNWEMGALSTADFATVDTDDLSDPQSITISSPAILTSTRFYSLELTPHTSGDLRVEAWQSSVGSGPKILDFVQVITGGEIGTPVTVTFPNPLLLLATEDTFFTFSGVGLKGGLQTTGPYIGQTVVDFRGTIRTANELEYVTQFGETINIQAGSGNASLLIKDLFGDTQLALEQRGFPDNDVFLTSNQDTTWSLAANNLSFDQTTGNITYTQNSVTSEFSIVSANPEGNLTKPQGSRALFIDGDSSGYCFKQTGTGNTGWLELIHSGSGVVGPVSSVDNALSTWNGVDGDALNSVDEILATADASFTTLRLGNQISTSITALEFVDETDATTLTLNVHNDVDAGELNFSVGTFDIDGGGA